ncbi:MAG: peptidoglycan DD-metalloendopeptidase family protein [Acidobacteriota bacterium]
MKRHTIIFVPHAPHARMKFRKWRISTRQMAVLGAVLVLLPLLGLTSTVSYFSAAVDQEELERIRRENDQLRTVNQTFETSLDELSTQLEEYQGRIHKLAIVAGIAELSPSSEAGIGGMTPISSLTNADLEVAELEAAVQEGDEVDGLRGRLERLSNNIDTLQEAITERNAAVASLPSIAPVQGLFTSGFGYRKDPFHKRRAFHAGLDIVAAPGTPIMASGDAIVLRAGRIGALGNAVYLSHGDGIVTRYGHLQDVLVTPGQRVRRGDAIGTLGNTGRSTGPHLHYEVRVDNKARNPLGYILDR